MVSNSFFKWSNFALFLKASIIMTFLFFTDFQNYASVTKTKTIRLSNKENYRPVVLTAPPNATNAVYMGAPNTPKAVYMAAPMTSTPTMMTSTPMYMTGVVSTSSSQPQPTQVISISSPLQTTISPPTIQLNARMGHNAIQFQNPDGQLFIQIPPQMGGQLYSVPKAKSSKHIIHPGQYYKC